MHSLPVRPARNVTTTVYARFRGVDFSSDPTKVDDSRSPWAPNMMSVGGAPEKRPGWRTLYRLEPPINGIYYVRAGGVDRWLVHGADKLYLLDLDDPHTLPQLLKSGLANAPSSAFVARERLFILTGRAYLCFDGQQVVDVAQLATVPTVTISRPPAGGGQLYQPVNLLSDRRCDSFLADGEARLYRLSATDIAAVHEVEVNGQIVTSGYSVNAANGTVTFAAAPAAPALPGADNVRITYAKPVPGYADRIARCAFAAQYGVGGADHWFVSGNPEQPGVDWVSALSDPTYFPDVGYAHIGARDAAVAGYAKAGEYLAILKADSAHDAALYLRTAIPHEGGAQFPLRQGATGAGALSHRAMGTLRDEALYLSGTGVTAIASGMTAERSLKNRSHFVDPLLCAEGDLAQAVAVHWDGRFVLAVGGRCYVLDGRQHPAARAVGDADWVYECYHWEGVPAVCFLARGKTLWFGTADGRVCRFNDDLEGDLAYHDDGAPIVCEWSTKTDDDGHFSQRKHLQLRGCGVLVKAGAEHQTAGTEVLLDTDRERDVPALTPSDLTAPIGCADGTQLLPFARICRAYATLRIRVRNGSLHEGLRVLGIVKRFTKGRYL